jgi:hypothetical protein
MRVGAVFAQRGGWTRSIAVLPLFLFFPFRGFCLTRRRWPAGIRYSRGCLLRTVRLLCPEMESETRYREQDREKAVLTVGRSNLYWHVHFQQNPEHGAQHSVSAVPHKSTNI